MIADSVDRPALVFVIAFASTLLGSISGGSSSLLTTPSWVALGYSLPLAVASDKLAGALWTLVGARNYLRRRAVDWRLVVGMAATGIATAYLGTRVTTGVDPNRLKPVVGALIVLAVLVVAARPRFGTVPGPERLSRRSTIVAALPLGFYEGLLGSGNSILATLLLSTGRGFDLLRALGHYYLVASAWCGFAAAAYWAQGFFEPALAVPAAAGAIAGGYLGSRIGNRFGVRIVRGIFIVAGLLLGSKLLLGW